VRKRPLGKTEIEVSELSLGTWGLSGGGYGPVEEAEVDRVLDRAVELGVDLFDTADVYGCGAMERRLGARLPRASTYVVTKIGTDLDAKPPRKRFDLDHLRPAFERSRERLRRERIDVVLLHNPTMHTMGMSEPFDFLKELKRLGALRAWGVSAGDEEVARAALEKGAEVIEIAYNVFCTADLHAIAGLVMEKGAAVLARSVLAHGLLTGLWLPTREFPIGDHRRDRWTDEDLRRRVAQLDAVRPVVTGPVTMAEEQATMGEDPPAPPPQVIDSLRAVALRFALANQVVTSAVLGPRSAEQLVELVRDAGDGPPYLRDTVLAEIAARVKGAGVIA
jgi:aryl-alcohol dehydrogenase-like predicted oxidoreductase